MSMEQVLDTLQHKSFAAIRPLLPAGELRVAGNADSLQQALGNLGSIFLFAVMILLILLWGSSPPSRMPCWCCSPCRSPP